MAKNRMIDSRFWNDTYVSEIEPDEKLFFLYLLTNQKADICGIYELPIKTMVVDTGIEKERILEILEKMELNGKIMWFDGWIQLRNFLKYQNTVSPSIDTGIKRSLLGIPLEIRKKVYRTDTVYRRYIHRSGNLNFNSNLNLNSNFNPKSRKILSV